MPLHTNQYFGHAPGIQDRNRTTGVSQEGMVSAIVIKNTNTHICVCTVKQEHQT